MQNKILTFVLSLTLLSSSLLFAATQEGQYYSTDVDSAVEHAKKNPVDMRYIGSTWYNRSTSKSFRLPKMLNQEMNSERVEGSMGADVVTDKLANVEGTPQQEIDLGRTTKEEAFKEKKVVSKGNGLEQDKIPESQDVYIKEIRYEGHGYIGVARDIRARNVTVDAYKNCIN